MSYLNNVSLKTKLVVLTMLTTISALIIASSAFVYIDQKLLSKSLYEHLQILARITAERSTAAIAFNDKKTADTLLESIEHHTSVIKSCIYDIDGNIFSKFNKPGSSPCENNINLLSIPKNTQHIHHTILLNDRELGTLFILASNSEEESRLYNFISISVIIIFITSLIALFFTYRLHNYITSPLTKLKSLTEDITKSNDYSKTITTSSNDEIGALYTSFNTMISQLQIRENARNLAEQKLKESEYNLGLTLSSIGDGFIATNRQGHITRMNPAAESLTGLTLQLAQGKAIESVLNLRSKTTNVSLINNIKSKTLSGETIHSNETALLISNKQQEHIVDFTASPIRDINNSIYGMVLILHDMTQQQALKQSLEKGKRDMQAIMDHTPSVIYVKDINGRYTYINEMYKKIFHLSSDDIIGKTDFDIFPHDIATIFHSNDQDVLSAGRALEIEETASLDDGLHTYISIKFPMFNNEGNIYSIGGISSDITDLKLNEEKLHRNQKMQALGKLTGGIAHDYNNMLGIILGYSELLELSLENQPDLLKYAMEISKAGNRGSQLTKKMLNFSRVKPAEATTFDISQMLTQERQLLEKTLTSRIQLSYSLSKDKCIVTLDYGDLEDAIINMCINSMHAIKDNGQITITTSTEHIKDDQTADFDIEPGHYVKLSISDDGCGMPDDIQNKIFEPFYSTKGEMGTGLGLSQVYGFLKRAGGFIQVISSPQQGTTITLYFPQAEEQNSNELTQSVAPSQPSPGGKETILVVDDEPALQGLTTDILQNKGYAVYCASNAQEALDLLSSISFDLLISDVIMPDMNGFQLASIVQKEYPAIKIQLISGYSDIYHETTDDQDLDHHILHKPYSSKSLLKRIRVLLSQ